MCNPSAWQARCVTLLPEKRDVCNSPAREARFCNPSARGGASDWTEEEFGSAALGDKRLVERLMQLGESFFAMPTANIPQACGTKAAAKAAYRFFDNDQISMGAILAPHFEATEQRVRNQEVALVVQDTSSLNYTRHPITEGLGPINTIKDRSIGLLLHGTMAFTPEGTPLACSTFNAGQGTKPRRAAGTTVTANPLKKKRASNGSRVIAPCAKSRPGAPIPDLS